MAIDEIVRKNMEIKILTGETKLEWDDFVGRHTWSYFAHLSGYKDALGQSQGYEGTFLYITDGRKILSLAPFFLYKDLFLRKKMIAHAGILFDEALDGAAVDQCLDIWRAYFQKLRKEYGVHSIVVLNQIQGAASLLGRFPKNHSGQVSVLKLDSFDILSRGFDRQIIKAVNKAVRSGVVVCDGTNEMSIKNDFYPLYARWSRSRHGTPPHSLEYFLDLWQNLSTNMMILTARRGDTVIAALLGFYVGNRVYIAYNPSMESSHQFRPNDLLHYNLIKWACENEFSYFDFGAAQYEGQIQYKIKWGADMVSAVPALNLGGERAFMIQASSWRVKIISDLWRLFMPLWLANRLGPIIRRKIGR